jgi:hypothetical protein
MAMSTEHARIIESLYQAFARLDGAAMAAHYADDAVFDDEAFHLVGKDIGKMWCMLTSGVERAGKDVWKLQYRDVTPTSAHWEAHYLFSATKRVVHNKIDSTFVFNDAGLIVRQTDVFPFWRWSRQALGPVGLMLGWTPWLRSKVRKTAAASLAKWQPQPPPQP